MASSQNTRKTATSPLPALFVSALFVVGLLAGLQVTPPADAQAAGTVSLTLTDSDYQTPIIGGVVYGPSGYAYLVLRDRARDTDIQHDFIRDVKVTSQTCPDDPSGTGTKKGILIDLVESGARTGVFQGGFGFDFDPSSTACPTLDTASPNHPLYGRIGTAGANAGTARIKVSHGDTVTVAAGSQTLTFTWRNAQNAAIVPGGLVVGGTCTSTAGCFVGLTPSRLIQVTDADLNANTAASEDHAQLLKAFSDSDPAGEWINLRESGVDSAVFSGSLILELTNTPNNNRLFVQNNDRVWLTYDDPRDATGQARRITAPSTSTSWIFQANEAGTILLDRAKTGDAIYYLGSAGSANGFNRMVITIIDADQDAGHEAEPIQVYVRSGAMPSCTPIPAGEAVARPIAGRDRLFTATYDFSGLVAGTPLNVAYCDGTTLRQLADTVVWRPTQDATVSATFPSEAGGKFIGTSAHEIVVTDTDSNRRRDVAETITVRAKSTTDPTSGVQLSLVETSSDSGIFAGSLTFTTGTSAGSALAVADGDRVVIEYQDPLGVSGEPVLARSAFALWRAPVAGTISLDATNYYRQGSYVTKAQIVVVDNDRNDPQVLDTVSVTATGVLGQTSVTLTESGRDTGLFHGVLGFSTTGASGVLQITAGASNTFQVVYGDPFTPNGASQVSTTQRTFVDNPGTTVLPRLENANAAPAQLQDAAYVPAPATGTAGDRSINIITYSTGTPERARVSSSCPEKDASVWTTASAGEHRHVATIALRNIGTGTCPTTPGVLGVRVGDTLLLKIPQGTGAALETEVPVRLDSARSASFTDAAGANLMRMGGNQNAQLTVTDNTFNVNRGVRDLLPVTVTSQLATGNTLTLTAVETGADTGIFRTSLRGGAVTAAGTATLGGRVPTNVADIYTLQAGANSDAGYGISDFFSVCSTATGWQPSTTTPCVASGARVAVRWFQGTEGALTLAPGFGTGGLRATVADYDGLQGRTFESRTTQDGVRAYSFQNPGYIAGSEAVLVTRVQTGTVTSATQTVSLQSAGANNAVEALADANGDGKRTGADGCRDVTVTGTKTAGGPTSPGTPAATPVSCSSVNTAGDAVTIAFSDCSPSTTPTAPTTCSYTLTYAFRARFDSTCGTGNDYRYKRTATGIEFCANPAAGRTMQFEYAGSTRSVQFTGSGETETIALPWSTSTKTFTAVVPTEATATANNGNVNVGTGPTRVTARYADPGMGLDGQAGNANAAHFRRIETSALWRSAQDAVITWMTPDYQATIPTRAHGPAVGIQIVDSDADLSDQSDTITVTVTKSTSSPENVQVVLRETGAHTGTFRGVAALSNTATCTSGTCVLTLSYTDEHSAAGLSVPRTSFINWRPSQNAGLTVGNAAGGSTTTWQGPNAQIFLTINDCDADVDTTRLDKVQVRLRATHDPVGELVDLTQNGATSCEFRSSGVSFESTPGAANGKLYVRGNQGDVFWAEYIDPVGTSGGPLPVVSSDFSWVETNIGQLALSLPDYVGTVINGPGSIAEAYFTVTDHDLNLNPRLVDRASGVMTFGATSPVSLGVTLIESGANTGVFFGVVRFKTTGTAPDAEVLGSTPATSSHAVIPVTNNAAFTLNYADAAPTAAARTMSADWHTPGFAVIVFDRAGYSDLSVPARLTLFEADTVDFTVALSAENTDAQLNAPKSSFTVPTGRTGVYVREVTLSQTAGSSALHVSTTDTIRAAYDDNGQIREATALVGVGDTVAPVTTLVTSTSPATNADGWFHAQPTVSFTTSENVANTFYVLGSATTPSIYTAPFPLGEGQHTVTYWSVDAFDNEETAKTTAINVDLTDPTGVVTAPKATSRPAGVVELAWTGASNTDNPLNFGRYNVYRGAAQVANYVGNSTTETFSETPPADGSFTYYIAVADASNRTNLAGAVSVPGVSDRVAPQLSAFTVTPTLVREAAGETSVAIEAQVVAADLPSTLNVLLRVTDPFGTAGAATNLTRSGTSDRWTGTYNGFTVCGVYQIFGAAFDAAGNEGGRTVNVTYEAVDRDPPLATLPDAIAELGAPLSVNVTENCKGIASLSYRIDGGSPTTVSVSGNPLRHAFNVPTSGLSLGAHVLEVTATDANSTANTHTYSFAFTVIEPGTTPPISPGPTPPANAPTIQVISRLTESDGVLRFRVASGSALSALTVSFDGQTPQAYLSLWTNSQSIIEVPVDGLDAGAHTATIVATNAAGPSTQDVEFEVLPPGFPLPPDTIIVTRTTGGAAQVSWAASRSTNVGGYLVHRASSPSAVIADVGPDVLQYVDTTAQAGTRYIYAVTAYGTNDEGRLEVGDESAGLTWFDKVQTSSFDAGGDEEGFFASYWWVFLILLVVIAAVALAYVYRERLFTRRGEQEAFTDEYPDEAAPVFGVERHQLRCPNCTHEFSVSGQKPIVTTCPNCGKKGILR